MLTSLLPLVVLSLGALGNLAVGSILHRTHSACDVTRVTDYNSVLTLLAAMMAGFYTYGNTDEYWSMGTYELTTQWSMMRLTLCVLRVSFNTRKVHQRNTFEYSTLVLFGLLGLSILVSCDNLILFYLGRELYSYSAMIMANLNHKSAFSTEAGLKFFRVGSFASVVFLLGSAWIYFNFGTLSISEVALFANAQDSVLGYYFAVFLMMLALTMKLGAAPVHWWVPDVYEGAPTESTLFMVLIPKVGLVVGLTKFIDLIQPGDTITASPLVFAGALSVLIGTRGAFQQSSLKRFLSFSGIVHMGFIMLGLSILSPGGHGPAMRYLLLYIRVSLLSWSVVSGASISRHDDKLGAIESPMLKMSDLTGMSLRNRGLALVVGFSMFSMAGIPPFAGFFAKFDVLVGVSDFAWPVALAVILVSVLSTVYYLRLAKLIFFEQEDRDGVVAANGKFVPEIVVITSLMLLMFMVFPAPFYLVVTSLFTIL